MDQLHFLRPVRRGMVVILQSQVNQAWRTSMEVGVRVDAEDPATGSRVHCCTAYLTFVALDAHGQPRPIPPLKPDDSPDSVRRIKEAELRRTRRLEMRELRKQFRE